MIFDYQQASMVGGIITNPDWTFGNVANTVFVDHPYIQGAGGGTRMNITGTTLDPKR